MSLQTIGDLAQSFALRRQSVELTRQMDRLTLELSSGEAADLSRHLSGNLLQISDIDRELALLGTHRDTARLAATDARLMQTSLSRVQDESAAVAATALTVGATEGQVPVATLAAQARDALGAMIGALNGDAGGRALFSGTLTDRAPLASAESLLSGLRAAVAGATTTEEMTQRLDGFFDDPAGGFATMIYRGGDTGLQPNDLGAGESVALDIRANDPRLRGQIRQVALAALLDDSALPLAQETRRDLSREVGETLLNGQNGVTRLRADLGSAEARISQAESRIAAETTALRIARNDLVSVDVFETAGELEQVQFQLETLYTLTARAARLNLVNFLS